MNNRSAFFPRGSIWIAFLGILAVLFHPEPSYAYVDPNLGGIIYQIFFPVLMALLALWVFVRNRFLALIRRLLKITDDGSGKR